MTEPTELKAVPQDGHILDKNLINNYVNYSIAHNPNFAAWIVGDEFPDETGTMAAEIQGGSSHFVIHRFGKATFVISPAEFNSPKNSLAEAWKSVSALMNYLEEQKKALGKETLAVEIAGGPIGLLKRAMKNVTGLQLYCAGYDPAQDPHLQSNNTPNINR